MRNTVLLLLACLAVLAACAKPSSQPPSAAQDGRLTIPPLPIQQYMFTLPQAQDANQARFTLAARCLSQFGFSYTPPSADPARMAVTVETLTRRYGITDAAVAATRGYHLPGEPAGNVGLLTAGMSPAELAVFEGPHPGDPTAYAGRPIPSGGCDGQARGTIAGNGEFAHSALAAQIQAEGFADSMKDQRVVAVFARWSACMATAGYHYANPLDSVSDDRWTDAQPNATELAVARTDLNCKASTGLVHVWYTVESAIENASIAKSRTALLDVRRQRDAQLAVIGTVLDRHE